MKIFAVFFFAGSLTLAGCVASQPIVRALQAGDDAQARQIIERGLDYDKTVWAFNFLPLEYAAAYGHDEAIKDMVKHGADINKGHEVSHHFQGATYTPLSRALANSRGVPRASTVRTLLGLGARVDDISLAQARNRKNPCVTEEIAAMVEEAYAKQTGAVIPASAKRAAPSEARPLAAAPAGLSAADIERIAKAVRGGDAPASAPSFADDAAAPRYRAAERPDDLAVIVGIETYSDIAAKASYAERDAAAFKAHVRALGVPERNIVLLTGSKAVRSALTKNVEGWLPRMAKPESRVYFYFSGHGAPDVKTGQAYLVPWDGDPNFLDATAYPVAQLYKKLSELPAKQVLVAMDSCFSGAGGRSVLASGARPLVSKIDVGAPGDRLTVLSASASTEVSGSLDAQGHGAFTYFLLEGLNAGKATPKDLAAYLTPRVQDEARRLNRDQTPQLRGDGSWPLR